MGNFRWPFLVAAIVVALVLLTIELGSASSAVRGALGIEDPPGIAIAAMALLDIQLVFSMVLYGLGLVVPGGVVGRVQGVASLILSILVIIASIVAIFIAITLVLLMLALIASFFGIIVYVAVFGHFARSAAAVILAVLFTGKLVVGGLLLLTHPRFVQNKGLVLLLILSLVTNIIISFLHALVPIVLVSITDAIGAIIAAIIALIWAIILLIGAIIAIIRIIRIGKRELPSPGAA